MQQVQKTLKCCATCLRWSGKKTLIGGTMVGYEGGARATCCGGKYGGQEVAATQISCPTWEQQFK